MRSDKCGDCGHDLVWDSDAGSAVCPDCGTLQDPSQTLLDAHIDTVDKAQDSLGLSYTLPTRHLRPFRNSHGWDLAGQGNLAAAERSKSAMRQYISALTARIGHSALSTRTQILFDQAMACGRFHYGRKARLVAGSSLVIALREARKGETIKDIAYLLDESPVALARILTIVLQLLGIKLTSLDPSWHLPVLQKQLSEIILEPKHGLPQNLINVLKSIHLPYAFRTASSLCELVSRDTFFANMPSPPISCAVYILALESEKLYPLPNCGEIAKALGRRFGVSKDLVMRRYKSIYDRVALWASDVPWTPFGKDGKLSSAKLSKRGNVARCMKDIVEFHEHRRRAQLEYLSVSVALNQQVQSLSSSDTDRIGKVDFERNNEVFSQSYRPRKKKKLYNRDNASKFLISVADAPHSPDADINADTLEVASHLLASDCTDLIRTPTRLQLILDRKRVEDISDEELFGENELEMYMRTAEEKRIISQTFDWARDIGENSDDAESHTTDAQTRNKERGSTSRINIEALNHLLDEKEALEWAEAVYDDNRSMTEITDCPLSAEEQSGEDESSTDLYKRRFDTACRFPGDETFEEHVVQD